MIQETFKNPLAGIIESYTVSQFSDCTQVTARYRGGEVTQLAQVPSRSDALALLRHWGVVL